MSGTNLPTLNYIEQFCREFDANQASWAPDRGEKKKMPHIMHICLQDVQ